MYLSTWPFKPAHRLALQGDSSLCLLAGWVSMRPSAPSLSFLSPSLRLCLHPIFAAMGHFNRHEFFENAYKTRIIGPVQKLLVSIMYALLRIVAQCRRGGGWGRGGLVLKSYCGQQVDMQPHCTRKLGSHGWGLHGTIPA